jgi:hypothetical protein
MVMYELQPILVNERTDNDNSACYDLMAMAERELMALVSAVTDLFGPEQATIASEDWLDELVSLDCLHGSTNRDLQLITVAALARLVIRMAVTLHYPNSAERAASRFLH